MIEILNTGIASSFQDLGRPGCTHLGVGHSGAVDRPSHRLANRLVGNPESAATIETCGGLQLRVRRHAVMVVTGASGHLDVRDGPAMAVNAVTHLTPGAVLTVRPPKEGVRYYVAVRGGFEAEPVLGSRSFDTLAGLGPRLVSGEQIAIGPDPGTPLHADLGIRHPPPTLIHVSAGPRRDWFTDTAWSLLTTRGFTVSADLNRVGTRLSGPVLERAHPGELPSEGIVEGAVQVPHDGQPIVMLADHPVTGGYPVIAVVAPEFIAAVAQARPGTTLRFRHSSV
ncbi:MAG TPA: biotin-dependent carboxyltransferase family protein [Ilumatobacteraceae bacterium]|nr:biotin-dependent carboxyltransferase family protein [Ilumatobacteraceae bacterium]